MNLIEKLEEVQDMALRDENIKERMKRTIRLLEKESNGVLRYYGRMWIPKYGDLTLIILDEAHKSKILNSFWK